jgi:serine/threonine-protein kinase
MPKHHPKGAPGVQRSAFGNGLEVVDRLGVGGVAEVYRVIKRKTGQPPKVMVIKKLRGDKAGDPFFSERFCAEADLVQMLRHPNEIGSVEGQPFVVLDYVAGTDLGHLQARLSESGRLLATSTALFVAAQLLRGLHYVHTLHSQTGRPLRIVHRDVTPDNVLISFQGDVRLTDFGIALLDGIEAPPDNAPVAGKLGYLAPEQALGGALDARTDVFSAGCVLYEMLTGHKVYETQQGETEHEVLERVHEARFVRPARLSPQLPEDLERVVLAAMERKPRNRYPDAEAFGRAVENLAFVRPDEKDILATLMQSTMPEMYAQMRMGAISG